MGFFISKMQHSNKIQPLDGRKLKSVLRKAVLKTERRSQEFIIVSRDRQKKKLFLDDIYYFEIKGRVVDVHGPEGIFTYYEQIGEMEDKLRDKGLIMRWKHAAGCGVAKAALSIFRQEQ